METFVWRMELISWREEWKCAMTTSGGQCVLIHGVPMMPVLLVDSSDLTAKVRYNRDHKYLVLSGDILQ